MNIAEDVEGRIHAENPAKAKYKLNDVVDGDDESGIHAESNVMLNTNISKTKPL